MNIFIKFSIMVFFGGTLAMAHNEDKPGPHGGHIRMPANFHTEVVANQDGSFHVYLLDMQNQNPMVKNSQVKAYIKNAKNKFNLKCKVKGTEHFLCAGATAQKSGSLIIKATRDGVEAKMDAEYILPLK